MEVRNTVNPEIAALGIENTILTGMLAAIAVALVTLLSDVISG